MKRILSLIICAAALLSFASAAWGKTDSGYVNDVGGIIEGATQKGIDVSVFQGEVDWDAVKNSDIDFVIIRCGYGSDKEENDDKKWQRNVDECTRLGIPFGVYLCSYAENTDEAQSEAAHVLRLISGYKLDYPVYYDLEVDRVKECSAARKGEIAAAFCDTVSAAGYDVGIYANLQWWQEELTSHAFDNKAWYKWVAQYNSRCSYEKSYTMWQATDHGQVPGITGDVDINFWFEGGTKEAVELYPNTYENTRDYRTDIMEVARTQLGYTELSEKNGTPLTAPLTPGYTKYGEYFGNPYADWCSHFVLWCTIQADVPTSVLCRSTSCLNINKFAEWFTENGLWRDSLYTPQSGDVIFFDWDGDGNLDHIGLVEGASDDGKIHTIEGNVGENNGYMCARRERKDGIVGYGVPNYGLQTKINGMATAKHTAYMLPDLEGETIWSVWRKDELQVLCRDGDFYLVLYPYSYTGRFVAAYVPTDIVDLFTPVPTAEEFYTSRVHARARAGAVLYNDATTAEIIDGDKNYTIRATLDPRQTFDVLFTSGDFAFIQTDKISGYILQSDIMFDGDAVAPGDINRDGYVDENDAIALSMYCSKPSENALFYPNSLDFNHDGLVNNGDAAYLMRHVYHPDEYPVE